MNFIFRLFWSNRPTVLPTELSELRSYGYSGQCIPCGADRKIFRDVFVPAETCSRLTRHELQQIEFLEAVFAQFSCIDRRQSMGAAPTTPPASINKPPGQPRKVYSCERTRAQKQISY